MKVSVENWSGVLSNEESFELTDREFLLDCIDELNGKNKTMVALSVEDEAHYMIVGGGNVGRYSVVGEKDGEVYNLINSTHRDEDGYIEIVTGGQAGDFEMKYCVDKAMAMQVATYFFEHEDFDKNFEWEIL